MGSWTLAVQAPSGRFQLQCEPLDTLGTLRQRIGQQCSIRPAVQKILAGFPPRQLAGADADSIEQTGLKNGELLRVAELPEAERGEAHAASIPSALASSAWQLATSSGHACVNAPTFGGDRHFQRKVIDADNSCLFNGVAYCLEGKRLNMAHELRELIASVIVSDPAEWDEAVLGKTQADYAEWILRSDSWGGGVECSILSKHYSTIISCIDCKTLAVYHFGEGNDFGKRIMLMYDGIHYDVITGPNDATVFALDDVEALEKGVACVKTYHDKKQFTDTATFDLKCMVCGEGIKGEKGAQAHALKTGHQNFAENK